MIGWLKPQNLLKTLVLELGVSTGSVAGILVSHEIITSFCFSIEALITILFLVVVISHDVGDHGFIVVQVIRFASTLQLHLLFFTNTSLGLLNFLFPKFFCGERWEQFGNFLDVLVVGVFANVFTECLVELYNVVRSCSSIENVSYTFTVFLVLRIIGKNDSLALFLVISEELCLEVFLSSLLKSLCLLRCCHARGINGFWYF